MTTTVTPAIVLSRLRERRGLVEHVRRHCLCCSQPFPSTGIINRVCEACRAGKNEMEFGRS